ncbi:MAG: sigma-70 family RNA polymerase sigma factor [Bacteroidales bacterium]|nr:sigma-70 family RNA polymerase sigma factor [Bacteroidales bacterium]
MPGNLDKYTISHIKNELNKDSRKLFEFIYKTYFNRIKKFILNNKGSDQDAKDVFQEGVLAVIRNINENKVKNDTIFVVYLFSVCRYIWFNHLRVPKFDSLNESDLSDEYGLEENDFSSIEDSIEKSIFQRVFCLLDEPCRKLLKSFFDNTPLKEITDLNGLY